MYKFDYNFLNLRLNMQFENDNKTFDKFYDIGNFRD